jgi:hypothetical protein
MGVVEAWEHTDSSICEPAPALRPIYSQHQQQSPATLVLMSLY